MRRSPPLATIALIVLVVGGALAGAGWWWWLQTPNYAAGQMLAAQQARDSTRFAQYVDLEAVSTQIVALGEGRLDEVLGDLAGRAGGMGGGIRGMVERAKEQIKGGIQSFIENQIRTRVEEGTFSWGLLSRLERGRLDDLRGWLEKGEAPEFLRLGEVRQSGQTARSVLWHREGDEEFPVALHWAKTEGRWQVVAVEQS